MLVWVPLSVLLIENAFGLRTMLRALADVTPALRWVPLFLTSVVIPMALIVSMWWNQARVRRSVRALDGLACPGCLYDLRKIADTADRCPECSCDLRRWPVPDSWPREVGGGRKTRAE